MVGTNPNRRDGKGEPARRCACLLSSFRLLRSAFRVQHSSFKDGQALIESALVVGLVSLIFFGLVQMALLFTAKEVVHYAANKGARARTVGFNNFMIFKTVRVGTIPNAGAMLWPNDVDGGPIEQSEIEIANIPWYLGAPAYNYLPAILDYEDWPTVSYSTPVALADGTLRIRVHQDYPLRMPMHRAFYAADSVELVGESRLDNHYPLYLEDRGW